MPFVKLDTGILDSTLWIERDVREVFITALLMAEPIELREEMGQLEVESITPTGFVVPPGWYGIVRAAGVGILKRAGVERLPGVMALQALGNPEAESRSPDFGGRRMVRVDGGYIILNYMKYRDKDHTAAERQRRLRERKKARPVTRNGDDVTRNITHSREQIADAYLTPTPTPESQPVTFDASMVASGVLQTCGLSGQNLARNLTDVARSELATGRVGQDVMAEMVASWTAWCEARREGKIGATFSAEKFFGDGLWKDLATWPWRSGNGSSQQDSGTKRTPSAAVVDRKLVTRTAIRNVAARRYGIGVADDDGRDASSVPQPDASTGNRGDVADRVGGDGVEIRDRDVPGRVIEGNP